MVWARRGVVAQSGLRKIGFWSREHDLPKVAMNCMHSVSGAVEPVEMLSRFRRDFFTCWPDVPTPCASRPMHGCASTGRCGPWWAVTGTGASPAGMPAGRAQSGLLEVNGLHGGRAAACPASTAAWCSRWMSRRLRPDAETSAERLFCHMHGRAKNTSQMIPGRFYSLGRHRKPAARAGPRCRTRSGLDRSTRKRQSPPRSWGT
jgi:hypothetical protein